MKDDKKIIELTNDEIDAIYCTLKAFIVLLKNKESSFPADDLIKELQPLVEKFKKL